MNEHEPKATDPAPSAAEPSSSPPPAKGGVSPLRIILILVLVAMIAALAYDWAVALPASQEAAAEIEKLVEESASRPADAGQASRADVQKVVGHPPSKPNEFDGGHYIVEEYHWMRGLPVLKPYYIKVVYNKKKGGEEFTLANVVWNQELEAISIPGGPVEVPVHTDPIETEDESADDPAPSGDDDAVSPPLDDATAPVDDDATGPVEDDATGPVDTDSPAADPEQGSPTAEPATGQSDAAEIETPAEQPAVEEEEAGTP
jgi:hypothetical protein